jgi:hypothetical protein
MLSSDCTWRQRTLHEHVEVVPVLVEQLELELVRDAVALLLHWEAGFADRLEAART